jgi:arginase
MTVAISLGYGYPSLVNCANFTPKVLPEDICIIGAKDIDTKEEALLGNIGANIFTLFDIERMGIVQVMNDTLQTLSERCDLIHVSLDVDVLDPLIAPGTGILSKGGLSYREISYIMETLGRNNMVSSMDIIEVNPLLDIKNQTAELAIELLLAALGGSYGDYQRYYLKNSSP